MGDWNIFMIHISIRDLIIRWTFFISWHANHLKFMCPLPDVAIPPVVPLMSYSFSLCLWMNCCPPCTELYIHFSCYRLIPICCWLITDWWHEQSAKGAQKEDASCCKTSKGGSIQAGKEAARKENREAVPRKESLEVKTFRCFSPPSTVFFFFHSSFVVTYLVGNSKEKIIYNLKNSLVKKFPFFCLLFYYVIIL